MYNINKIRADFPILKRKINGKPLVYFDNAATSQKPESVLLAMDDYYRNHNSNVHRGIHTLSSEATTMYEDAREKIQKFINARSEKEVILTKNITESINLVAYSWGRQNIKKGDEIILSIMEHHANLVPWQFVALEKHAKLRFIDIDKEGNLDMDSFKRLLNPKTKLVGIIWTSSVLGTINPLKEIIKLSHQNNTPVLVDAAQYAPHKKIDVQKLQCDFLGFTGHKMLGPMGTGVLWAKESILENMPPFLGGGAMIKEVYMEKTIFNDLPDKFEAGTPDVGGVVGLGAAIDYLSSIGFDDIEEYEKELTCYGLEQLKSLPNIELYGPLDANKRASIITFNVKGVHPHDVAQILDDQGIAIRVGHHCTMPLHQRLEINASCRASLYLYNTKEEIDRLVSGLSRVRKIFK